ncbi:putative oxidoreductase CipA [Auricularia subglabra TFB-10046 SS5]|nr:putative oxidoreductase CipA [Auricularia subglabra TFB-10046 SS5]
MSPKYAKDQPAGFSNRIEKVAIVGAGGNIGGYFVRALLATGKHTVTALTRPGSTSALPEGVRSAPVNYDDPDTLVAALEGQQFLVITLGVAAPRDTESKLIRAAAAAGVPYIMPNGYSPDPLNVAMLDDVFLGAPQAAARAEIETLGVGAWVTLGCGFWYEWSLLGGADRFGVDLEKREVTFFDDGEERITTSTWAQCGRALAALLSLKVFPEDANDNAPALDHWANKCVYIASFRVNQKHMFEVVKRVSGTADADWKVAHVKSAERYQEAKELMQKGDRHAFSRLLYTRIFFPTGEGDHSRHGLANEVLGLPKEDIDEATKEGYRLLEQGRLTY